MSRNAKELADSLKFFCRFFLKFTSSWGSMLLINPVVKRIMIRLVIFVIFSSFFHPVSHAIIGRPLSLLLSWCITYPQTKVLWIQYLSLICFQFNINKPIAHTHLHGKCNWLIYHTVLFMKSSTSMAEITLNKRRDWEKWLKFRKLNEMAKWSRRGWVSRKGKWQWWKDEQEIWYFVIRVYVYRRLGW